MLQKTLKKIPFIIALAMVVSLFPISPVMAASQNPKLVESVKVMKYDKSTKTWHSNSLTKYSYNEQGDPIQYEWISHSGWGNHTRTISYTYRENGKPKCAKYKETGKEWLSLEGGSYYNYTKKGKISYNKRGFRTEDNYKKRSYFEDGSDAGHYSGGEIYKHKKCGFYTFLVDREDQWFKAKSRKNGMLKKVMYRSKMGLHGNKWRVRAVTYKNGLLKRNSISKEKYIYDEETGLVKKAIWKGTGGEKDKYKYIFTYSEIDTTPDRYATMINGFMDSNFIWY